MLGQIAGTISQFDQDLGGGLAVVADLVGSAANLAMGIVTLNPKQMIEGAMQLAGSIANVINLNKQADAEISKFRKEMAQAALEYSIAFINTVKDIKGVNDSIFNSDINNSLIQGMKGYNEATKKQSELLGELENAEMKVGVKRKKTLGITTGTKDVFGNLLDNYKKILNTEDELINKDGTLNRTLTDTLLKMNDLPEDTKIAIENIIAAEDAAKAAMEQVNNDLSSIAGSLGKDLQDALVQAFKSGDDAAIAFGESVEKVMESVITQMLFSTIFGEQFKSLEERMKNSYSEYGDQDITDDITFFYNSIGPGIDAFNKGLRDAQSTGESRGFSLFAPEEDSTERKGISGQGLAQASQESISELSGRMLASMMLVTEIRDQGNERKLYDQAIKSQLEVIAFNTGYCHYLLDIKNTLNDIELKGVKVLM